ncbi:MAG: PD40 domain-containing protein, partial [Bacteroidia bacterium]|nr:PD40 domain-containing protein [Bacteroidia bacterium]
MKKTIYKLFLFLVLTQFNSLDNKCIAQGFEGYYQYPDIHENTIVFCAEGDLWTVSLSGGKAQRLTTHPEDEMYPHISPDGKTVSYSASYEGPTEIYTIPMDGGLTTRRTFESDRSVNNDWSPDGSIVYATWAYNKKPDFRLIKINTETNKKSHIPLDQASEASFDETGSTLFFVRPAYHRNVTKRYQGGTARQIWKYTEGEEEATKLTNDHMGESHHPMYYDNRVYFITDRDGIMNIWSMNTDGSDLKQLTTHSEFDVRYANISNGIIVYQLGADIWKYDINSGTSDKISITLISDLDQLREKWVDNPQQYITNYNTDKEGKNIVLTARGRAFVIPVKSGRVVSFTGKSNVRYRDANFSHDGKNIISLSDETGEFEFVSMPVNGMGDETKITSDGTLLRYEGTPSPDGKWLAYSDLGDNMYILDISTGISEKISSNTQGIGGFSWAPDSKWLAFVQNAMNTMSQIHIYNVDSKESFELTTDRANSFDPCWSPDGKFIYFISDRSFTTLVGSPWGPRQPEPYFDASEKIYHVSLTKETRSPFRPGDELFAGEEKEDKKKDTDEKEKKDAKDVEVLIDKQGIKERIIEVPVKPGNYRNLALNDKTLYFIASGTGVDAKNHLYCAKIKNEDVKAKRILEDVRGFKMTQNGKKLLIRKGKHFYMSKAGTSELDLKEDKIDLNGWKFSIVPREDWTQIFTDAWRMERDYFYDRNMHGVDWKAMYEKYLPLVDRVTTRNELSDLIGRFVGELSALHTSVRGGDIRNDSKNITVANLGGVFSRDDAAGGYRIDYIYKADPDYPDEKSPLDDPYLDIHEGDIITAINGVKTLSVSDMGSLLRNQSGKQVRISLKRQSTERDVIVKPIPNSFNLRYRDWEYNNRLYVEEKSGNDIGYLHLRAMGSNDINQFYREFYPVF